MRNLRRLLFLLVPILLVAACTAPTEPDNATVEIDDISTQAFTTARYSYRLECPDTTIRVQVREGRTWSGAEFLLYRPRRQYWNRDLVVYAHGYINPDEPVGFPDPIPQDLELLRDTLLCEGFALAASSYSANGLAIEEGIRDSHLLNPLFWWYFDYPDHTYVMGHSQGGIVSLLLAESFPWRYDLAVPMCGPVGGSLMQLDYIAHVRVMFDVFLNDALVKFLNPDLEPPYPSYFGPVDQPTTRTIPEMTADIVALMTTNPAARASLVQLASVVFDVDGDGVPDPYHQEYVLPHPVLENATIRIPNFPLLPLDFNDLELDIQDLGNLDLTDPESLPPELIDMMAESLTNSLLATLRYYVAGAQDVLDRGGGSPFDNTGTEYTGPPFPSEPIRYQSDAGAVRYWSRYVPSGRLLVPTITLHGVGDPDVPVLHEDVYADRVWFDSLLEVNKVPTYGHCVFPPELLPELLGRLPN